MVVSQSFSESHQITSVVVIDMLPEGERGMARRLDEHLGTLHRCGQSELPVSLVRVDSRSTFFHVMGEIAERCEEGTEAPILHFEAHGSPIGIACPEGETIEWSEVAKAITPINRASGHNLIIVMSTCYGFWLRSALRINAPAPFAILVAPKDEVTVAEIELPTERFYADLTEQLRLTDASDRHLPTHQYLSALGFFCRYWLKVYSSLGTAKRYSRFREDTLTYVLGRVKNAPKNLARRKIKEHTMPVLEELLDQYQKIFFHGEMPLSIAHFAEIVKQQAHLTRKA